MKPFIISLFLLFSLSLNSQRPDLNYFLEKAKSNSPLINRSKNENIIADLDLKQIKSILSKPEINIESSVLFAPIISHDNNSNQFQFVSDGADKYSGYDLAVSEGGQYQAIVSVKQSLFTGSRYKAYLEMNDISHRINENNIALTIHEAEQLVTYQYLLCLKSGLEVENSSLILKELGEQLSILKKLVENALYRQTDLLLLQIEFKNYEVELNARMADYRNNFYDLNLLCGINDTAITEIQEIDLQLKSSGLSGSQFITNYILDSLNILASLSIDELKYKPEVGVFADAGLNAVYLPSFNRLGFSTGVTFRMNLFDGKQKEIMRNRASVNLNSVGFEKISFITKNNIYKNKTISNIKSLDERMKIIEEQSSQYRTLFDVYTRELSQGEVSALDYKILLKDITAKMHERLLLKMEKQILINSYNYWNF
jgi:outer membrane protein TolC